MSTPARKRLMRDFKRLQQDPPAGISGAPQDNNIMLWNAVIFGYFSAPVSLRCVHIVSPGIIWDFFVCFRSLLCYRQKCSFLPLNTQEQRNRIYFRSFNFASREEQQVYDSNPRYCGMNTGVFERKRGKFISPYMGKTDVENIYPLCLASRKTSAQRKIP